MRTLESARLAVAHNPRQLRVVGPYGTQDMIVVEDRETGERRVVPNKRLLVAGNNIGVAFEMTPPGVGFGDDLLEDE